VDIWSAGCIFAELLLGSPLFPCNDEVDTINMICKYCGTPDPDQWPGVTKLAGWESLKKGTTESVLKKTLNQKIMMKRSVRRPRFCLIAAQLRESVVSRGLFAHGACPSMRGDVQGLSEEEKAAVREAVELIDSMLQMTPSKRKIADDLYSKSFFHETSVPRPTPRDCLRGVSAGHSHVMAFEKPTGKRIIINVSPSCCC
jgi:serine/threonine protein kinase